MQNSEKKVVQFIHRLWWQKALSIFFTNFLNFAAAFAWEISLVFLAIFVLMQAGYYSYTEPFWLPQLLLWMLISTSFGYAGIQMLFSIPSFMDIASELDQKGNHLSLFSTAYCFAMKREKPVGAFLAIDQAQEKIQRIPSLFLWSIPYRRLWAFLALFCTSFLLYTPSSLALPALNKLFPVAIKKEVENVQPSAIPKKQKIQQKKAPKKESPVSIARKPGIPKETRPNPTGSSPKAQYQEQEIHSLFGEGEKWISQGYLPSSSKDKKEQGKTIDIPIYQKFQHQIEDYKNNPSLPPEHQKAIQRYFSLLRQE